MHYSPPGDLREIIIYPLSPLPLELIKGEIIFGDYGTSRFPIGVRDQESTVLGKA